MYNHKAYQKEYSRLRARNKYIDFKLRRKIVIECLGDVALYVGGLIILTSITYIITQ